MVDGFLARGARGGDDIPGGVHRFSNAFGVGVIVVDGWIETETRLRKSKGWIKREGENNDE